MKKKCPYNYIRVNKQLEAYDCSDDCIIKQEVEKLTAELDKHTKPPEPVKPKKPYSPYPLADSNTCIDNRNLRRGER